MTVKINGGNIFKHLFFKNCFKFSDFSMLFETKSPLLKKKTPTATPPIPRCPFENEIKTSPNSLP